MRKHGPVAFVLSGGGPLGAVQVGWLQALLGNGVQPDILVGTSVGALNALMLAADPTVGGAERLSQLWLKMRKDDLFPGGKLVSAWHALRKGSYVYENAGLRRIINSEVSGKRNFGDLVVPLHINATTLETGDEKWFSTGCFLEPLLASAAMPGVFPPVVIDGITYIDGGVSNNVAISKAINLGAKTVYVLNVNAAGQGRNLHRPHDFMMHGFVLARSQRYRREIESSRRLAKVVEMPIPRVGYVPFTNMSHAARLIDAGFEAATALLDTQGVSSLAQCP
ncbi:MAG: patatin-like phospholipase family protein [Actinomycetota bacterium]